MRESMFVFQACLGHFVYGCDCLMFTCLIDSDAPQVQPVSVGTCLGARSAHAAALL